MSIFNSKKPTDRAYHIGVEVEFLSPFSRDDIADMLLSSPNIHGYFLHGDSSVHGGEGQEGHELCFIFKQKNILTALAQLAKDLKTIKAHVNDSCGFHVHLDMRKRDRHKCFSRLILHQDMLFGLVKKERRINSFCHKNTDSCGIYDNRKSATRAEDSGHYDAINAGAAYGEHRTIEVRMHHGTVKLKEMYSWINLLLVIISERKIGEELKGYINKQAKRMAA